jgi:hypothetical protein
VSKLYDGTVSTLKLSRALTKLKKDKSSSRRTLKTKKLLQITPKKPFRKSFLEKQLVEK